MTCTFRTHAHLQEASIQVEDDSILLSSPTSIMRLYRDEAEIVFNNLIDFEMTLDRINEGRRVNFQLLLPYNTLITIRDRFPFIYMRKVRETVNGEFVTVDKTAFKLFAEDIAPVTNVLHGFLY